jgi:hypothetical protein
MDMQTLKSTGLKYAGRMSSIYLLLFSTWIFCCELRSTYKHNHSGVAFFYLALNLRNLNQWTSIILSRNEFLWPELMAMKYKEKVRLQMMLSIYFIIFSKQFKPKKSKHFMSWNKQSKATKLDNIHNLKTSSILS